MNDRELLELAAKAAGYVVTGLGGMSRGVFVHHEGAQPDECGDLPNFHWDPLTDDGDALRLAGKLCFNVNMKSEGCVVDSGNDEWIEFGETLAATRRAVVRAAAEIGKSL